MRSALPARTLTFLAACRAFERELQLSPAVAPLASRASSPYVPRVPRRARRLCACRCRRRRGSRRPRPRGSRAGGRSGDGRVPVPGSAAGRRTTALGLPWVLSTGSPEGSVVVESALTQRGTESSRDVDIGRPGAGAVLLSARGGQAGPLPRRPPRATPAQRTRLSKGAAPRTPDIAAHISYADRLTTRPVRGKSGPRVSSCGSRLEEGDVAQITDVGSIHGSASQGSQELLVLDAQAKADDRQSPSS
jgi:hypothetical protein